MNNLQQNNIQNPIGVNDTPDLTIADYLIILRIHYRKIVFFALFGLFYGLYYTYTISPNYQATATVIVREKPGANMIMDLAGNHNQNRISNVIQLIQSRALGKEVVKYFWESNRQNNMHLFGTRIFYPKGARFRKFFREIFTLGLYDDSSLNPKNYQEPYNDNIGDKFSGDVLRGMNVANRRNTNIIEITFNSINADEARRVANAIAKIYVRMDKEWSSKNALMSVNFLDSLINVQKQKIEESDQKTRDFMLENNMFSLEGDVSSIVSQLNGFENQMYKTDSEIRIRKEKIEILESKLTQKEKTLASQLVNNINIQLNSLRLEIGKIETQILQNSNLYGDDHGLLVELNKKLVGLKRELDDKVDLLIKQGMTVEDPLQARQSIIAELLNLDSEIMGYELQKDETRKMLNLFNRKLNNMPDKQMELARLNRDTDILNQNYGFLRQKLEEAKLSLVIQVGDAQFLDSAKKPDIPISPKHQKNIIAGLVLGTFVGLLITFLIEFLDNTLKTIDEIGKYNLTVLGIIPSIGNPVNFAKKKFFPWKNRSKDNGKLERRLITREDPKSPVAEAYRGLRTNMLYSSTKNIKSILVSSAGPGEGKTTTVANLAITYANLGKRTLLVDTDLRRPVVHKVFGLDREPGVTNYISGQTDSYNKLIKNTEIKNLFVMTSGLIPPNPSEILGSDNMLKLVKSLENDWDIVLFDSPPLVAVTDANMISKEIDRIVLVIKVGQTDKKAFHHTINNLKNIDAPLGGIIMNAVTNKSSYGSYYYYYYHQYYHYYGSDKE